VPSTPDHELDRRIAGIAALDQPVRRDLYRLLCAAEGAWTSRDEASDALGVGRPLAAFHLDKLVDAGVLETRFERRTGRRGPGAGRPAKLYRPVATEVAASVPERHYDLAGSLLADAVTESARTGEPVTSCLRTVAQAAGVAAGTSAREAREGRDAEAGTDTVLAVLRDHGYEPTPAPDGGLALANCPFHRLAEQQRTLVCGMNLDFLTGVLAGAAPSTPRTPRLAPEPGYCCVRIPPAGS
jgi:predicted ArsR family transcriptional regulator